MKISYIKMKKIIYTTLLILLISLMLAGCSTQTTPDQKGASVKTRADMTPEEVLAREVADGKLVEVYDEFVRVGPGKTSKNWMIINNVKETEQEFTVYPCDGCSFGQEKVIVGAGEYKIIEFDVSADEGQKEIRVKDGYNNAYGYAQISVIIE